MPFLRVASAAFVAAVLSACGAGSGTDLVTEDERDLTGTFEGGFSSLSDSVALLGYLTLELTEERSTGALTGAFALEATVDDGAFQQPIAGRGPLVGGASPTEIAPLYFTAIPDFCPSQPVEFTGTYDRRSGTLLVGGQILVLDADCAVLLTFPSTISLSR